MSLELRPYQREGLAQVRRHIAARVMSVLLVGPTGMGKGTVAACVLSGAVAKGNTALFIVHRLEILLDVRDRLKRAGVERVGVLCGDSDEGDADAAVFVCSVQTLFARGVRPPANVIVWDEAHHCTATTYQQVRAAYPDAVHLGLTATPERADGTALGDVFDQLVVCVTARELMEQGHLTWCDVIAPAGKQKELAQDPVAAYLQHAGGRRAVFFCANRNHAATLAEQLRAAGVPAAAVDGKTPAAEREATLEQLRAGELLAVTNVFCLTEGWDCPPVEVCVLARGCGSASMFLQCVGRALRPSPATGKGRALLLDLCGSSHQHGLPDDDRIFSLSGKPISLAKKLPPISQCKACGAVFRPVPKCPRCGTVPPPPALPQVKPSRMLRGPSIASEREQLAFFEEHVQIAQARGYKDGYAGARFKEKFGFWPPRRWRFQGAAA